MAKCFFLFFQELFYYYPRRRIVSINSTLKNLFFSLHTDCFECRLLCPFLLWAQNSLKPGLELVLSIDSGHLDQTCYYVKLFTHENESVYALQSQISCVSVCLASSTDDPQRWSIRGEEADVSARQNLIRHSVLTSAWKWKQWLTPCDIELPFFQFYSLHTVHTCGLFLHWYWRCFSLLLEWLCGRHSVTYGL